MISDTIQSSEDDALDGWVRESKMCCMQIGNDACWRWLGIWFLRQGVVKKVKNACRTRELSHFFQTADLVFTVAIDIDLLDCEQSLNL